MTGCSDAPDDSSWERVAGGLCASLVGGPFDDPTVYVDLQSTNRVVVADLGSLHRCSGAMRSRVTDVLVSHAHADHFDGFAQMVRHLVHTTKTLRVYGPADIADRVAAMVDAFTWERSHPDAGPSFEVTEYAGGRVRRHRIRPGPQRELLDEREAPDGVLRRDKQLRLRVRELDHGTPSIAYAVEETDTLHVRSEQLRERGYKPGPWLGTLKRAYRAGELAASIETPAGRQVDVATLADALLERERGGTVVYATDFRESEENIRRVIELAAGAGVLFCECCYTREHADRAEKYAHLTTDTCGRIAGEAEVDELVPFHFSRRYETRPEQVYAELQAVFPRVVVPESVRRRMRE